MASISPGTRVRILERERRKLAFPPQAHATGFVAVHSGALRAPKNALTLVVTLAETRVAWVGAIDEQMLEVLDPLSNVNCRPLVKQCVGVGPRLWQVVSPGLLTARGVSRPLHTVYDGERPWVVIGETPTGRALAAPLNDAKGNPKWWAPQIAPPALELPRGKPSQIELAHVWTVDPTGPRLGSIVASHALEDKVLSYFSG